MPLRPDLRSKFYGAEWRRYRLTLIGIAGNRCSSCRAELPSSELVGAHITHDPRDMALVSVMCFSCHSRHDAPHAYAVRRRTQAHRDGQLWLLAEIEFAPYPSWMIPRRVLNAGQGRMFE
jgi:hypothetical protein